MKVNISIILVILSVCFLSCESKNKWINQYDTQADASEVAKICKNNNLECGKLWMTYQGVNFEISCGLCETGYECKDNLCRDVNECMDPTLYDCPKNSTCVNEEGTYSCICKENYSGVNCVPDTRTKECKGLPENAEWNTASEITQSWNGNTWTPSTEGSYSEESSRSKCRYKCIDNYEWNGSKCVKESHEEPDSGDSEPDEDVDTSDFTDDSGDSEPEDDAATSAPDEDANEPDEEPITRTETCQAKPENTVWNTVDTITQTYTGADWEPSTTPNYNETPSESECRYKCASGYNWNGDSCTTQSTPNTLTLGNICTGQTKCFNNEEEITCPSSPDADFFGQDTYYVSLGKCTPQSFTIQTLSSQKVVYDNNTGLTWQQTTPTSKYTWENADSYCNDLTYAGYSDWRLPTPQELLTIIDNSRSNPAIDTTYFPETQSSGSWSSSTRVGSTSNAWYANFYSGNVNSLNKTNNIYVRCVRGSNLPTASFNSSTVNGDVIVTDTETGLVWQKSYVGDKTWEEALAYCESLTYSGYSDWRLPDKNELSSLVNYGKYHPAASDFPDMPSEYFWSSSTYIYGTNLAWLVDFDGGYVSSYNKTNSYYVRCVRNAE